MDTQPLYNWLNQRAAGVLLHLSALPSASGIGNFGAGARRFVDFLSASGMSIWQLCPLGPTGFGDSPYQCFSAFAGNPYFIDLEPLVADGLLERAELKALSQLSSERVDYGQLYELFWPVLKNAYTRFHASGADHFRDYGSLSSFREAQAHWLEDYALFMALKDHFDGKCWLDWPPSYRDCAKARTKRPTKAVRAAIEAQIFYQYLFHAQLKQLRSYAASQSVQIMGDVPIFVALDSADVWANRPLFQLKKNGQPKAVAGVPPDYFSADGQLWGNPLFDWSEHVRTDFAWWLQRISSNLGFYDIVRLDHFRGFESYWSVPAQDTTARNGEWKPSPGMNLFRAIHAACPQAKIVAEDLGVITEAVEELLAATGLPGMAVLQFAFGGDASNAYLPHNHKPNSVVYSGTHDNDTSLGWFADLDVETRDHVCHYLNVSGESIGWDLIRACIASEAKLAIIPLQDLLSLGSDARLNTPGAATGNWQWRTTDAQLDRQQAESAAYLMEQNRLHGRI